GVKAGEKVTVSFAHKFTAPGTYAVQVRLEADDLELDDSRTVVVAVRDTVPVLLVNGKPAVERRERATDFLRVALNPYIGGPVPRIAPIPPRGVSVSPVAHPSAGE